MPQKHEREKIRQTNIRLSPLGNRLLDNLVEYHGVNKTAVFDLVLREHARDIGLLVAPPPVTELASLDHGDPVSSHFTPTGQADSATS